MDYIPSELNCPICLDLIVNSISTLCGHSFCEICLLESFLVRTVFIEFNRDAQFVELQ